jgi:hypothetical protein
MLTKQKKPLGRPRVAAYKPDAYKSIPRIAITAESLAILKKLKAKYNVGSYDAAIKKIKV